ETQDIAPVCQRRQGGDNAAIGLQLLRSGGVQGYHAGSTYAEIVLQGDPGIFNLPPFRLSAKLPDQFSALRQSGGPDGVTFRQETAGGIGNVFTSVGIITIPDELLGCSF